MSKRKAKIVPVYRKGREHEGHVDGWIIDPDSRIVRDLPPPENTSDEGNGSNGESGK